MSLRPTVQADRGFAFGPFLLDPVRRLLWKDGLVLPTTSKSLDVLLFLIEHRDRVVTKDEFLHALWGETVVEEGTLVKHLSSLRKAMGVAPGQHDYIVTIPGAGYRFVARLDEVTELPRGLPTMAGRPAGADRPTPTPLAARVTTPPAVAQPAPRSSRFGWWKVAAAVGATACLAAVSAWAVLASDKRAAADPALNTLRRVTFGPGSQFQPTWSADGRWFAYASDRSGNVDVWVQSLTDPNPTKLTASPAADWQPSWSPDGRWIAFRSERDGGGLFLIPSGGGAERRLAPGGYRPRWSPDSTKVLFLTSMLNTGAVPRVFVVTLDGGSPEPVAEALTAEFASDLQVAWHPDGRRVSLWGRHRTKGWTFETVALRGGEAAISDRPAAIDARIGDLGLTLRRFGWDREGRALYFEGRANGVRNLWRVTVDPDTLAWKAGPEQLTIGPGNDTDLALTADGRTIAFTASRERTQVWSFPLDARSGRLTGEGRALSTGGDEQGPDAQTRGDKVLYRASLGTQHELREFSLRDGRERLLLRGNGGSTRTNLRWSPDGHRVAYDVIFAATSGQPQSAAAAVLTVSSQTEQLLTTRGARNWATFGWSPDGRAVVGSCRAKSGDLLAACLLPLDGAPAAERVTRVITAAPGQNLYQEQFSPDGSRLLFMAVPALEGGVSTINVVPAGGGPWTPITDGRAFDDKPRWAPDGRTIYFVSNRDGFLNVWARRFDPNRGLPIGEPFRVTSFDSPRRMLSNDAVNSIEISVVADRLILPVTESSAEIWVLDRVK